MACKACKVYEAEVARLEKQNERIMDRLMAVLGQVQATSDAIGSNPGEDDPGPEGQPELSEERVDEQAREYIEQRAKELGMDVAAFED